MPVHDWTRVEAGIFHDFHNAWLTEIRNTLNGGLLPSGYYCLTEQHAGRSIADILTLHAGPTVSPPAPPEGGIAVAEVEPRVRRTLTFDAPPPVARGKRRTLVVRHVNGHRIVALLEVVSPSNKDRPRHVAQFARKVAGALRAGVHVLVVDLFPPGPHDLAGIHGENAQWVDEAAEPYRLPPGEPLTLASYTDGDRPKAYLEHLTVGWALPEMPLFLAPGRYVNVPLEPTYREG
jgi:hypothetical protein